MASFRKCVISVLISGCILHMSLWVSSGTEVTRDKASPSGKIAFSSYMSESWQIWSIDPDGSGLSQLTHMDKELRYPAWSPDGKKLAFADNEGQIWVMEVGRRPDRLGNLPPNSTHPAWSPDGSKIVFVSYSFKDRREDSDLWMVDLRQGKAWKLREQAGIQMHPAWSPDGSTIAYSTVYRVGRNKFVEELWLLDHDGSNPRRLLSNDFSNIQPDWSPDGVRIAFASDKSGNMDIWVVDKDGTHTRQLTFDRAYDADPSWSPDGSRICFASTRSGKMDIWMIDSDGGNPRQLTGFSSPQVDSKEPNW